MDGESRLDRDLDLEGPILPEYEQPLGRLFASAINALVPAHEPLLGEIQRTNVDHITSVGEVPGARGASGGLLEMPVKCEVPTAAIVETDLAAWYELLWTGSRQLARHQMRALLSMVGASAQQVGNTLDLRGAPLSHDAVLDMLERMEFQVDEEDNPIGIALVGPRHLQEQLQALGPPTAEQEERRARIIAEKRRLQDAAKRLRRLDQRPR